MQNRKEEMTKALDRALTEHVSYFRETLAEDGYLTFSQEMETLSDPKKVYTAKLFGVDLELERMKGDLLSQTEEEDKEVVTSVEREFQGLNLEHAQELSINYMKERDALQGQCRQMVYVRDQLPDPRFDLSSLGAIFSDEVTSGLIQKASALTLQLNDDHNVSTREQERL